MRDTRGGGLPCWSVCLRHPQSGVLRGMAPTVHPQVSEEQLLAAIDNAARILAKRYACAYLTRDDIRAEIAVMTLEALPRFDPAKGKLDNFVYSNAVNRCLNLVRSVVRRTEDPPCRACWRDQPHAATPACERFRIWNTRNERKACLAASKTYEDGQIDRPGREPDVAETVAENDLMRLIDERLDIDLRADYLLMLSGKRLTRARREAVQDAVRDILGADAPQP